MTAMTQAFRMAPMMRIGTVLLKALLRIGVPMGSLVLLSVRGRKSGKVTTIPIALVHDGHERWLVAVFGEVNWVRNLRTAGRAQLTRGRRTEPIEVIELGTNEAAPILQQYFQAYHWVPFLPPYFTVATTSPLADFEREATRHPVFHIASTGKKLRHRPRQVRQ